MSVYKILEQVANDPSKNAKIAILTANKDNDALKEVCRLAYDPSINFYIKKIPEYTPLVPTAKFPGHSLEQCFARLAMISSRELTGNAAIAHLKGTLESVNAEDADVLARVVGRDLRAGFSDSTVNKVWKDLIPEFPYMRCSLPKAVKLDTYTWAEGVYSQLKADGMYANVNLYDDGSVSILSRAGTEFPLDELEYLVDDVRDIFEKNTQSHGELLVKRDGEVLPRQIGNGILNKVAKGGKLEKGDTIIYMVWDNIPLTSVVAKGVCTTPYKDRYADIVKRVVGTNFVIVIPTKIVHNMQEAMAHYREMLADGMEGTIIKTGNAIWKDGTSKEQCKMKLDIDVDLVIKGFNPGKGKYEHLFGSIICQTSDGKMEVNVSGFSDDMRAEIHFNRDNLIDTIITVKSNSIMPPSGNNALYSLFLPRFEEFRKDKKVADDLAKVLEQFENAIK